MSDWNARGHEPDDERPHDAERRERELQGRRFDEGRHFAPPRGGRGEGRADYNPEVGPFEPGGGGARGHGEGGDGAYGQMARRSLDTRGGGYGGAGVGGWGQPGLNSQWGDSGYGPLNTGLEYGQDGDRFGPRAYAEGDFGRHDPHAASYRSWRDAQLANHDRDYGRWRSEQAKRYDEDYHGWRTERHSAFSKAFESWRAGRGGQTAPDANAIHGANPTLTKIAEGHEGGTPRNDHDETKAHDKGRG